MASRIPEERLRALQHVTDAALSHLPLEQMLTELLTRVTELLEANTAAILMIEGDGRTLVARAAKGLEEEVEREVRLPVGRGFAGRIAAERRPVIIRDVATADIYNPILREKGLQSLVGVPLLLENRVIGVLHVGSLQPRDFQDDDVEVLERAADRAALAIGGRLAERERGLAEAFQRSLMPPLPKVPGIDLAGRYKPAAEAHLGGDWYDAFPLPTGAIGLTIGDVVGRGFHAAALMGQMRSGLRAFALDRNAPAEVIEQLSLLLRQLEPAWGATVLYALLEPHLERVTLASAGHPPPVVVSEDGDASFFELPPSVPLAAVRHPVYEQVELDFPPGSTLVLYTDGLIERSGESLDSGLERLLGATRRVVEDPQQLCDRLIGELLPSGPGTDDAALLVVTLPRLPDPFKVRLPADPNSITLVRRAIGRWLTAAGASDEEVGEIMLATCEACANVVEHAYGPSATEFDLEASSSRDGVTVVVRDTGQWRRPRGRNRGRGFTLMRGLMDEVRLDRDSEGTVVHLSRRLVGAGA